MFHVATMMPTLPNDNKAFTNKKSHIGNDNVVIVFCEDSRVSYSMDTLTVRKTKREHIFVCFCYKKKNKKTKKQKTNKKKTNKKTNKKTKKQKQKTKNKQKKQIKKQKNKNKKTKNKT